MKCQNCGYEGSIAEFRYAGACACGTIARQCPQCHQVTSRSLVEEREEEEEQLKELCKKLDTAINEGDLKKAAKMIYELLDLDEQLGGIEGLEKFLDYAGERLAKEQKKARKEPPL